MDAKIHKKTEHVYTFVEISRLCILWQLIRAFAKSRPTARDSPAARGPRPATAHRPGSPRPATARCPEAWRPGGPEALWPSPDFPQFFCTDLHRVMACKMDDGEVEFVYHLITHMNPCFCLLHVVQIKTFSFSVHSSLYRNRWHNGVLSLSNDKLFSNHILKVKIS